MEWCAGVHRFRDGLPDWIAKVAAGEEIAVSVSGRALVVTPQTTSVPGCPEVSISAFRPKAGRWLRRAAIDRSC